MPHNYSVAYLSIYTYFPVKLWNVHFTYFHWCQSVPCTWTSFLKCSLKQFFIGCFPKGRNVKECKVVSMHFLITAFSKTGRVLPRNQIHWDKWPTEFEKGGPFQKLSGPSELPIYHVNGLPAFRQVEKTKELLNCSNVCIHIQWKPVRKKLVWTLNSLITRVSNSSQNLGGWPFCIRSGSIDMLICMLTGKKKKPIAQNPYAGP